MARLLIVDDNAVDRELARRSLRAFEDLEIVEADDGQVALDICLADCPDLVLTDLRMPALDGLGLVEQLSKRLPLVPVILMTAQGSEQVAAAALAAGAASYVPKSEMAGLLAATVEQALTTSAKRRVRADVLRCFRSGETHFELPSNPALILPFVAHLQGDLERIAFGDEQARTRIGTALAEALSNAIVHGNLEVSSDLRDESTEPYHRLIAERRALEPWSRRRVSCRIDQTPASVTYLIRDEGSGFDRSELPDPTHPESMLKARGRGLFLMHAFMDEVEYNEAGNEVRLTKRARRDEPPG